MIKLNDIMPTGLAVVVMLALALLFIILGPYCFIWALNTLFPVLNIPFNFDTWVAVVLLHAFFNSAIKTSTKG